MVRINIDTIQKIQKDRNIVHDKVTTTYSIFYNGGKKYVQIDTYGRDDRAIPNKLSQSFQIDEETAKYLVKLLVKEFDFLKID